jgi:hypothetical protein
MFQSVHDGVGRFVPGESFKQGWDRATVLRYLRSLNDSSVVW